MTVHIKLPNGNIIKASTDGFRSGTSSRKDSWLFLDTEGAEMALGFPEEPPYNAPDQEWKQWRRKVTSILRKNLLPALAWAGLLDSEKGYGFSARGYCSCGCSPGWGRKDGKGQRQWITIQA